MISTPLVSQKTTKKGVKEGKKNLRSAKGEV
jgi:hypothetical protein